MTEPDPRTEWAPAVGLVVLGWVSTALAVLCTLLYAVLAADPEGALLFGVAAAGLAAVAVHGSVARPRLRADLAGVEVRGLTGRRHWSWAEVSVRLVVTRRLGRDLLSVELDAEHAEVPGLVLLGRLELGADPQDVTQALLALRG